MASPAIWQAAMALEYSMAEVASIAGVPLNTIKTRMRLGKEALRRYIHRTRMIYAWYYPDFTP
jgi:DNA-directed RNA polymerase specialized sigma24 family protein